MEAGLRIRAAACGMECISGCSADVMGHVGWTAHSEGCFHHGDNGGRTQIKKIVACEDLKARPGMNLASNEFCRFFITYIWGKNHKKALPFLRLWGFHACANLERPFTQAALQAAVDSLLPVVAPPAEEEDEEEKDEL
jgi:hypothetical protein